MADSTVVKLLPSSLPAGYTAGHFEKPQWSKFAGENGGFVSRSFDGRFEAIAITEGQAWEMFIVRVADGETLTHERWET